MAEFYQRLKGCRERQKNKNPIWTQGYVADKIGVARSTYTAYENGTKLPPLGTVNTLADIFEVSTDYLLGRTENSNRINYNKMDEEPEELVYNGQAIKLSDLNPDQRILIDWALSHESLSFKDKPQDFFELLDLIRNIKPHIEELEKKKNK